MRVIGIMSGTSLDGVDVAIVDIEGRRITAVAFQTTPYSPSMRRAILDVSDATTTTAAISRLSFRLGEVYAFDEVVEQFLTALDRLASLGLLWRLETIPLVNALEPGPDLVQVCLDFLGLACREVVAEDLELNLPGEFLLALFDDLGILLRSQRIPLALELSALLGGQLRQPVPVDGAPLALDTVLNRVESAHQISELGDH